MRAPLGRNLAERATHSTAAHSAWSLIGFAFCLIVPSLAQVQKYFALTGVAAYTFMSSLILVAGYFYVLPRFVSAVTEKKALCLAGLTFLILIAVFAVVYPIADSGVFGGGSDRDDNINVATSALLHARYPYYFRGYLGSPTHSLPGSLVLAAPFVLIGNSAYQNFVWLMIFFIAARFYLNDGRLALLMLWALLILSPAVAHELVTGGDLVSNSLYILLFMLFLVHVARGSAQSWLKVAAAILLGLGLSSRANFLLLLPLVYSILIRTAGWITATTYVGITALAFGAMTLPFYLYDPQAFYPLQAFSIVTQFDPILPFPGLTALLISGLAAFALSFQVMDADVLLRNSAIALAIPVLYVIVLSTIRAEWLDFTYAEYGLNFSFFGALASCASLASQRPVFT